MSETQTETVVEFDNSLELKREQLGVSRQMIETELGKADWPMSKVTRVERGTGRTTQEERDTLDAVLDTLGERVAARKAEAEEARAAKAAEREAKKAEREAAKKAREEAKESGEASSAGGGRRRGAKSTKGKDAPSDETPSTPEG